LGEIVETATGEMTDLISIKQVNANASTFEYVTTAFAVDTIAA
jgi:hypothetical protein